MWAMRQSHQAGGATQLDEAQIGNCRSPPCRRRTAHMSVREGVQRGFAAEL
jgi:hypothetical protein